jgi:hypothetical protein
LRSDLLPTNMITMLESAWSNIDTGWSLWPFLSLELIAF